MPDTEPTFNLKAVIHETGLNAETIRAWERRYGLLKPQRTSGGHRLYSTREIQILKWLVARQKEGMSISRAVGLWRSLEGGGQDPFREMMLRQPSSVVENFSLDELRANWVDACKRYHEQEAEQILAQAFAVSAPDVVCVEVLQKGLASIGKGWYEGGISVQQEHFASALAMRRLNALVSAAPPPLRPERLLAVCPPDEEHDFGLLLITYLLRRRGWDVIYLGANVPLDRLESALQMTLPTLVVSIAQTLPTAATLLGMASFLFHRNVPLAFGGGIFNSLPTLRQRIPGYFLGEQISTVPLIVENILGLKLSLPSPVMIEPQYQVILDEYLEKLPLIESEVHGLTETIELSHAQIEFANGLFKRYLLAALQLGDIHLLGSSLDWLKGLLDNYTISPQLVDHFLIAYRQSILKYLSSDVLPILEWNSLF
jgi:MerR family transcriptional regulator, light-induced transcriptional regulator